MGSSDFEFAVVKLNSDDFEEELVIPLIWLKDTSQAENATCVYPPYKSPARLIRAVKTKEEPTDKYVSHRCQIKGIYGSKNAPAPDVTTFEKPPSDNQNRPSSSGRTNVVDTSGSELAIEDSNDVEEESMDCENEESSNFQDRFPIKTKADFDSLCKTVESSKDKRSIVFELLDSSIRQSVNDKEYKNNDIPIKTTIKIIFKKLFHKNLWKIMVPCKARESRQIAFMDTAFRRIIIENVKKKYPETNEKDINKEIKMRIETGKRVKRRKESNTSAQSKELKPSSWSISSSPPYSP